MVWNLEWERQVVVVEKGGGGVALLGSPVLVYGGGNAFAGGVDLGGLCWSWLCFGRDFSGIASLGMAAEASGTKPDAF